MCRILSIVHWCTQRGREATSRLDSTDHSAAIWMPGFLWQQPGLAWRPGIIPQWCSSITKRALKLCQIESRSQGSELPHVSAINADYSNWRPPPPQVLHCGTHKGVLLALDILISCTAGFSPSSFLRVLFVERDKTCCRANELRRTRFLRIWTKMDAHKGAVVAAGNKCCHGLFLFLFHFYSNVVGTFSLFHLLFDVYFFLL